MVPTIEMAKGVHTLKCLPVLVHIAVGATHLDEALSGGRVCGEIEEMKPKGEI